MPGGRSRSASWPGTSCRSTWPRVSRQDFVLPQPARRCRWSRVSRQDFVLPQPARRCRWPRVSRQDFVLPQPARRCRWPRVSRQDFVLPQPARCYRWPRVSRQAPARPPQPARRCRWSRVSREAPARLPRISEAMPPLVEEVAQQPSRNQGPAPVARQVGLDVPLTEGDPVARLEHGNQATIDQIQHRRQQSRTQVTVKPIRDLDTEIVCDGYQPSPRLRDQIILRDRTCVFPRCTRNARVCDLDHIVPWKPADPRPRPTWPRSAGGITGSRRTRAGPTSAPARGVHLDQPTIPSLSWCRRSTSSPDRSAGIA